MASQEWNQVERWIRNFPLLGNVCFVGQGDGC
ncbi:hypothetical protein I3842_16G117000 [Carya illinoinensis]|uniref:Uncharacterized protein n=1 Tax=Carya illinoinensis TaxID=32201 RepID=A0A922A2A4_CARIL|nr:hypothetical protein I3842_16G117000 [Carya illinoinensis]